MMRKYCINVHIQDVTNGRKKTQTNKNGQYVILNVLKHALNFNWMTYVGDMPAGKNNWEISIELRECKN